jgi:hypothetical protein
MTCRPRLPVVVFAVVGLLWLAVPAAAQEKPAPPKPPEVAAVAPEKPPALGEVPKLQIQLAMKSIENAQLRAQQAAAEFEKARGDLLALVQAHQVAGYELDLQTLSYIQKKQQPEVKK